METAQGGEGDCGEDAEWTSGEPRDQHGPRAGSVRTQDHPSIHESEQEKNDLNDLVPLVLTMVHRIIVGPLGKQVDRSGLARQERDDRDQGQGRMDPLPPQRKPQQTPADHEVRPPVANPRSAQTPRHGHRREHQQERQRLDRGEGRPQRDDGESDGVGHESDEKCEWQNRPTHAGELQHVITGGDVDGAGYGPGLGQHPFILQ